MNTADDQVASASARHASVDRDPTIPHAIPTTPDLLNGTPRLVWLLVALTAVTATFFTVFHPNYRGPDEVAHTGLVVAVAERNAVWQPGSMPIQQGVNRSPLITPVRLKGSLYLDESSMAPSSDRPSYRDLGGDTPSRSPNHLVQHPPLYYVILGAVLSTIPNWQDVPFDRIVLLLRLLSVLLLVPLPWFCYAAARTLGASQGIAVAAAATPMMSPMLVHVSAVVNNDGLITILGAFVVWIAARVIRGDFRVRTAFQLGLLCSALMLTKGFGLVVVFVVVVIYLLAIIRLPARGRWRHLWRCGAAFAGPAIIGLIWWVSNLVQYHRLQPNGLLPPGSQDQPPRPPNTTFAESGWRYTWTWLDDFSQRFWFDDPTGVQSSSVLHFIALVMTILVIIAIGYAIITGSMDRRLTITLALGIFVATLQLLTLGWATFAVNGRVGAAQGRYLFGFYSGIGLIMAYGLGVLCRGSERWVVRAAVGSAFGMNLVDMIYTLHIYWWPPPGTAMPIWHALHSILYVSPAPPWTIVLVIVNMIVLGVITVIETLSFGGSGRASKPLHRLRRSPARVPA